MMAVALPLINAVIARFPNEKIHLAAYGSYVLPVGLIIEAPLLMLLATSTALCSDEENHHRVWWFMMYFAGTLTAIHALVAFTPLSEVVFRRIMNAPESVLPHAKTGFMITVPWTWAVAYRRFHQGVLVRFGHSKAVGTGAGIRIGTIFLGLMIGYWYLKNAYTATVVATSAHAAGVLMEAVFVGFWVRPVRKQHLIDAESDRNELHSWSELFQFYTPLALTSLFSLAIRPLLSTGMARMPRKVDSLAVFPVALGLLFSLRSAGMAYKEVVVSLLERKEALSILRRFTMLLTTGSVLLLGIINITPLADFWFRTVSGLPGELTRLGKNGLWLALLIPGLTVLVNAYQGILVYGKKTRGVVEAMGVNLVVMAFFLAGGILINDVPGYYTGVFTLFIGLLSQALWLYYRSRPMVQELKASQ